VRYDFNHIRRRIFNTIIVVVLRVEMTVDLHCCGHRQEVSISPSGITAGEPNEIRKNVSCLRCRKLVILDFQQEGTEFLIDQEILEL